MSVDFRSLEQKLSPLGAHQSRLSPEELEAGLGSLGISLAVEDKVGLTPDARQRRVEELGEEIQAIPQ